MARYNIRVNAVVPGHADRRRERERSRGSRRSTSEYLHLRGQGHPRRSPSWSRSWPATGPATSTRSPSSSTGASDEVPHGGPDNRLGAAHEHPRRQDGLVRGIQLKAAFGGDAVPAESLVLESLFQLGNWLIVLSSDFTQMGLVGRSSEVRFDDRLRPGEPMTGGRGGELPRGRRAVRRPGTMRRAASSVSGTGCLATPVALAEYCDPDDLRVLFSEIYQPDRGGAA